MTGRKKKGRTGKEVSSLEEELDGKEVADIADEDGEAASASTSKNTATSTRTGDADDPSDSDESSSSSDDEMEGQSGIIGPMIPPKSKSGSKTVKRSPAITNLLRLKEAKKKYKIKEVKRDLAALVVTTGKKIENACTFTQWSKKLRSWQKSTNTFWIVNCSHRKAKYPTLFNCADEWLYIAIEGAIVDRVLLSLVQASSVNESGLRALEALRQYFSLVGDEFTIDTLDQTLEQCNILKGETVEEWLVRRHELEDLLATTYRRKTDDQLLTLLRKSIPNILKPVNAQLVISAPDFINDRAKYEQALKSYARLIGYPTGSKAEAPTDNSLLENALVAGTTHINKPEANKLDLSSNQFSPADLLAAARFLANSDKKDKSKSNITCDHCNKKGHLMENCWKLHPEKVPDWIKKKREERLKSSTAALAARAVEAIHAAERSARESGLPTPTFSATYTGNRSEERTGKGETTTMPSVQGVKWDILCMATDQGMVHSQHSILPVNFHNDSWLLDSGAGRHVSPTREIFTDMVSCDSGEALVLADGVVMPIRGTGRVTLKIFSNDGSVGNFTLTNVAWVPELAFNLLSVSNLQDKGVLFNLTQHSAQLTCLNTDLIIPLMRSDNLYFLRPGTGGYEPAMLARSSPVDMETMHARLGHRSHNSIRSMVGKVDGLALDLTHNDHKSPCEACALNQRRKPISKSPSKCRATVPNLRVFTDMTGPFSENNQRILFKPNNHPYIVTFIDDCTRHAIWFSLPNKESESFLYCLERYMSIVGKAMGILRSDDAAELNSAICNKFYATHNIKRETTTAGSPQFNGVAESNLRTVMAMARKMRVHAGLDVSFGYFAAQCALSVYNNTPTRGLVNGMTPHQAWTGMRSDVSAFRVFGCLCWTHLNKEHLSKMDNRARSGIYLGLSPNSKGYLVYNPTSNRVSNTRNIIFDESCFPARSFEPSPDLPLADSTPLPFPITPYNSASAQSDSPNQSDEPDESEDLSNLSHQPYFDMEVQLPHYPMSSDSDNLILDEIKSADSPPSLLPVPPAIDTQPIPISDRFEIGDDFSPPPAPRRSLRIAQMATKSMAGVSSYIFLSLISICSLLFISLSAVESAINTIKGHKIFEPKTYKDAISCNDAAEWLESMRREFDTLIANDTFRIISRNDVPKGRKLLRAKWVYKVKTDAQGNLASRKSRLVAKGFTEVPGVDFFEIFHPVGQGQTFRLLLLKALCSLLLIFHIDIKGAFLHARLKEVIYMQLPPGTEFTMNGEVVVVRLLKSLYGLKQAGREWYLVLSTILISLGFLQSAVDPCLFVHPSRQINILAYVDDLLVVCMSTNDFQWLTTQLSKHFEIGSAEPAQYYLGQRISYKKGEYLTIDQSASIDALLTKYNMSDCNPIPTPTTTDRLKCKSESEKSTANSYSSLVGALLYLSTHTRPDISYAVNQLCSFCSNPSESHWTAAKRILRYLRGTKNHVIKYTYTPNLIIKCACDSDWAGDWSGPEATARSTTGYVIWGAGGVVVARSRKQSVVALSSCEAEYMSICSAVQEIVYIRQLLVDLYRRQDSPTVLECDNSAAVELTSRETHQQRAKHISIRFHFSREAIRRGEVVMKRVPGISNFADMLTKPLGFTKFAQFINGFVTGPDAGINT